MMRSLKKFCPIKREKKETNDQINLAERIVREQEKGPSTIKVCRRLINTKGIISSI